MSNPDNKLSSLSRSQRQKMLKRILDKKSGSLASNIVLPTAPDQIPESFYRFDKFPQYYQLHMHRTVAEQANISSPFFQVHDGIARDTTSLGGREVINFGTYNYLNLNGDPRVSAAAKDAIDQYGTSASASRIVSGERPPHRELEDALAKLHGTEAAIAFVSGHATNVSTIDTLLGSKDLIVHDSLIHNSILQGARISGATRLPFPHNDLLALDKLLTENRHRYEKVLIAVEGLYSMDGDIVALDQLIDIKTRHKALLMVDEAHSVGALGANGRGTGEHFAVAGEDVDIWMGTLSKTFSGCGGYIAGTSELIDLLKFTAPGFVYSVGMPPPVAAAAIAAIKIMQEEPERVERLHTNGSLFLKLAQERGLNTGLSAGYTIVPVITGGSVLAGQLSNALLESGINVQPIIYPAVEEKAARLRFFISSAHTEDQIRYTVDACADALAQLQE